jgi:hypothetical protein
MAVKLSSLKVRGMRLVPFGCFRECGRRGIGARGKNIAV